MVSPEALRPESTLRGLVRSLRERLRRGGAFDADRAAWELVCSAAGLSRAELLRSGTLPAESETARRAEELADRCLAGEPLAYLLGEWEFYGLPLDITRDVLIPRPDTEVLAELAIAAAAGFSAPRVLDLCAGSGCIGLAVAAQTPAARVVLGELDGGALAVCRRNIRRSGLDGRVSAERLDALRAPPASLGTFDVLVSNPPYIPSAELETLDPSVRDYEPPLALDGGADGLDFYRAIVKAWRAALRPGGRLLFEAGLGQAERVAALLRGAGYAGIAITPDLNGIPRVISGEIPPAGTT